MSRVVTDLTQTEFEALMNELTNDRDFWMRD